MSTATEMRDLYIAAETAVLKGQSYRMGERMLTLADLEQIRAGRREWEGRAAVEAAAGAASGPVGISYANFRSAR
jgi:hypothetical protein